MSDHTPNSNYHPSRANATSTPRIPTYALHIELPRLTSCNCASDAFTQFSSIPAHDEEYCNAKWLCALGKNRGFSRLSSQFARSILQKRWKCFQEVSHARIFSTQNCCCLIHHRARPVIRCAQVLTFIQLVAENSMHSRAPPADISQQRLRRSHPIKPNGR